MLKNITKFNKFYTNIQVELHKKVAYKVRDPRLYIISLFDLLVMSATTTYNIFVMHILCIILSLYIKLECVGSKEKLNITNNKLVPKGEDNLLERGVCANDQAKNANDNQYKVACNVRMNRVSNFI